MKKKKLRQTAIFLCFSLIILPIRVNATTTAQYKQQVEKYTAELQEKKNKIAKNNAEVAEIKKNIASIESQISKVEEEIDILQKEIEESNQKILKKSKESKQIMAYYQIASGDNAYLEYAFGAETITDMIYRVSIVEQLTEYNDKVMKELKELIAENNKKKASLSSKKQELNSLKQQLQSEKERIDADTASIQAGMPSLEEQLKSAQASLKRLQELGCNDNEDIIACQNRRNPGGSGSTPSTNGFYRPTEKGRVSQYYKGCGTYNPRTWMCSGHTGMDLTSTIKGEKIPLYPVAPGVISAIYSDPNGALVVKIRHKYNGTILYSTYAHLDSYANIWVGEEVDYSTRIGIMGNTGYSFGVHLHLEISTCDWKSRGNSDVTCSWEYYAQNATKNPADYITIPATWNNR